MFSKTLDYCANTFACTILRRLFATLVSLLLIYISVQLYCLVDKINDVCQNPPYNVPIKFILDKKSPLWDSLSPNPALKQENTSEHHQN